jgi:hypothetical protein
MDVAGGMEEEVSADGLARDENSRKNSVLEDLREKAGQITTCRTERYMEEAL